MADDQPSTTIDPAATPQPPDHGRRRQFVVFGAIILTLVVIVIVSLNRSPATSGPTTNKLPDIDRVAEGQALKLLWLNPPPLAANQVFEAWVVLGSGAPISAGTFTLGSDGKMVDDQGETIRFNELDLGRAHEGISSVFITVEPSNDTNPDPSAIVLVRGAVGDTTTVTLRNAVASGTISGRYLLSTPTDSSLANERSGVYFLTAAAAAGSPQSSGLTLPSLSDGWIYEGWVKHQDKFVSTGRFTSATGVDETHAYSRVAGPAFPGEDFLINAPADLGLNFPIDLGDGSSQVMVTVEPDQDGVDPTGDQPFGQTILLGYIPKDAKAGINYDLTDVRDTMTSVTVTLR